jgi:multisubunit Na+/H+ antiporter MnhE subunit
MPGQATARRVRRMALFTLTWCAMAAVWLLLVDTPPLPELLTGGGVATAAALGVELARHQRPAREIPRTAWLLRLWRPLLSAPRDAIVVSLAVFPQLMRPTGARGRFRTTRFRAPSDEPHDNARRALAEAFGSLAPNTIVLGVDTERDLLLAHQLRPGGGADALDPLRLR